MNYQIKYDCKGDSTRIYGTRKWLKRICVGLVCGVLILICVWSFRADWSVTLNAMESMAGAIGQGSGMQDAFGEFCLDILQGADCG